MDPLILNGITPLSDDGRELAEHIAGIITASAPLSRFSLETLATRFGITRGQLNRRVKAALGITTQQLVLTIRLNIAAARLAGEPQLPIATIAEQCGWDDAASFARAFRRHFATTPSRHRAASLTSATSTSTDFKD